jgi:hypothetical protein
MQQRYGSAGSAARHGFSPPREERQAHETAPVDVGICTATRRTYGHPSSDLVLDPDASRVQVVTSTVAVLLLLTILNTVLRSWLLSDQHHRQKGPHARFAVRDLAALAALFAAGLSVSGLTNLAALLAGRRRLALRYEWRAHLAGESGHDPVT